MTIFLFFKIKENRKLCTKQRYSIKEIFLLFNYIEPINSPILHKRRPSIFGSLKIYFFNILERNTRNLSP